MAFHPGEQEAFDQRRKFLEEVDRKGIPESEFVEKIDARADETLAELSEIEAERRQLKKIKYQAKKQLEEQARADAERLYQAGSPMSMPSADADAMTRQDIQSAREDL